jgi:hypothetical protein
VPRVIDGATIAVEQEIPLLPFADAGATGSWYQVWLSMAE